MEKPALQNLLARHPVPWQIIKGPLNAWVCVDANGVSVAYPLDLPLWEGICEAMKVADDYFAIQHEFYEEAMQELRAEEAAAAAAIPPAPTAEGAEYAAVGAS